VKPDLKDFIQINERILYRPATLHAWTSLFAGPLLSLRFNGIHGSLAVLKMKMNEMKFQ